MKTLLTLLLLSLPCSLDAQHRVLLPMCDTVFGTVSNYPGGSDGENGNYVLQPSQAPAIAYTLFYLPEGPKPDSICYVMSNSAVVQLWSLRGTQRYFCKLGCADTNTTLRSVAVPYNECGNTDIAYVGIGLHDCNNRPINGYVGIDAVYAWYPTPAVVQDTATNDQKQRLKDSLAVTPCDWRNAAGATFYRGTTTDIERVRPRIWLQGPQGVIWTGRALCFDRSCRIEPNN